jgi:hypothetical protein
MYALCLNCNKFIEVWLADSHSDACAKFSTNVLVDFPRLKLQLFGELSKSTGQKKEILTELI